MGQFPAERLFLRLIACLAGKGQSLWMTHSTEIDNSNNGPVIEAYSDRKKDKVYVAVVDENGKQRSLMWKFFTSGDDVYAGGPGMGDHKLSLHASGQCRWAHLEAKEPGTDRAFLKWERKPSEEQLTWVFSLVFPEQFLGLPKPLEKDTPLTLKLPMPPNGGTVELGVFYSTAGPERVYIPRDITTHYNAMKLKSGEWVYLVPRRVDYFDPSKLPAMPIHLPKANATETGQALAGATPVVMHLFCNPNDQGAAAVVEVAQLTLHPPAGV